MSNIPPPNGDRPMETSLESAQAISCEGCGNIFPLRQSKEDCPKCVKLAQYDIDSVEYKDIQKWPQCCKCGITRRNMRSAAPAMVAWAGELTCGSAACIKGTPAEPVAQNHQFGQPRVGEESANVSQFQPQASAPYPKRMIQNALNETTQARVAAVNDRLAGRQSLAAYPTFNVGTLNSTQTLLHHEHGGGIPGEEKVSIGWQVRSNKTPKRIDADLGGGIKKHAMSRFMPDIKAEILATINVDWIRSKHQALLPEETSFRWSGNRTLDPDTSNLSVRDFYDYYNRPSEANAAIKNADVPTFFKSTVKGQKGPKLFLEIYIDHDAWLRRTQSVLQVDDENSSSTLGFQHRKRGRNNSTASQVSDKMKQLKASRAGSVFQSEFNVSANRARQTGTIPEARRPGCNEITIQKYICVADVIGGESSIMGTNNMVNGSLSDRPFSHGSMKLAYDLYMNGGEHLVAKRFFRLDANTPADDTNEVLDDDEHKEAIENEGLRLAEGAWFLKEFYKYVSLPEHSGVAVDRNIQFSTAFIGKETSYPRSKASGKATEMGTPSVWWLIEPKRPSTTIKFSGTLKHPASRKDLLGLTIYAFAHFVYLMSKGTRVMADIQGTTSHINGKDTMVLFDIMTHSTTGNTGIGDFGIDGINSFLGDHTCGKVCRGLGLHEKQVEGPDDEEESESDQEKEAGGGTGIELEEGEVEQN